MRKRVLATIAGLAMAAAAFTLRARNTLTQTVAEIPAPNGTLPGELGRFVAVLNTANSESDAEYLASLARLREAREGVLAEATRLMSETPEGLFALRHSVVLAVAALRDPSALDLLGKVALNPQPLPPREVRGGRMSVEPHEVEHDVEDVVQGTIIALDAIDGIEMLADDGHAAALDLLVQAVRVDSNAIRGAALTVLAARDERREHLQRALSALPTELQPLAALRRANVRDVPQIRDPRAHLAGEERRVDPAPLLAEDGGRRTRPPAPRASGGPLIH